ncbi:MAG TPA: phage tail tip lysozyme [Jatrophihabitans sp.]|nr:phage tail tip lysozyme [Jatrophihabitans sp.]
MKKLKFGMTGLVAVVTGAAVALTVAATPASAAAQMNKAGMSPAAVSPASVDLSNERAAWNYLTGHGMTDIRAAGVIGNLDQESGMDPTIAQYGGGPGRGIAQWSVGGRWDTYSQDNVVWKANQEGKSRWNLTLQLDFIWYELHNFSYYGFSQLHNANTIDDAVIAFQNGYEGCGTCNTAARESFAHAAYNRYH